MQPHRAVDSAATTARFRSIFQTPQQSLSKAQKYTRNTSALPTKESDEQKKRIRSFPEVSESSANTPSAKLRHTEKEVYKNKKFRILAELYVGVDGFEPPTLCL